MIPMSKAKTKTKEVETALVVPEAAQATALEFRGLMNNPATAWMIPTSRDSALEIATDLADSGMVPKDFIKQPKKIMVAGMHGAKHGFDVLASLQSIAVINGNPGLYGDGLLAVVLNSKMIYHFTEEPHKDEDGKVDSYTCVVGRVDEQGKWPLHSVTYTKQQAITAGYWGQNKPSPWATNPARMLQMRARAFALRDRFSDVLKGLRSVEEMRDIEYTDAEVVSETPVTAQSLADKAAENAAKMKEKLAAATEDAEVLEEKPKSERALKTQAGKRLGASYAAIELNPEEHLDLMLKFASCCLQQTVKKVNDLSTEHRNFVSDCIEAILAEAEGDVELAKLAVGDITAGSSPIPKPEIAAGFVKEIRERRAANGEDLELGL